MLQELNYTGYKNEYYNDYFIEVFPNYDNEDLKYFTYKVTDLINKTSVFAPLSPYDGTIYSVIKWLQAGQPSKKKFNFTLDDLNVIIAKNGDVF